ncbi:kinase-like domain-containing protein [Rhizophagus irregularis DAOM 181602=DAOM 197198]|nr:kinase-like domain-containing protein [Rhizophagus irregularis DAOM 181602=DAOM 197198]
MLMMSDNMSLNRPARTAIFSKGEIKCKECKKGKIIDENYETCQLCYEIFKPNLSRNKVIDDFIRNTRVNFVTGSKRWILEFVPHDQFKNIEFIAEGGFNKRKFEDDSVEDSNDNDQSIKRRKFLESENSDYFTKEIELDINMSSNQPRDKGYVTKEIDLDINVLKIIMFKPNFFLLNTQYCK